MSKLYASAVLKSKVTLHYLIDSRATLCLKEKSKGRFDST